VGNTNKKCKKGYAQGVSKIELMLMIAESSSCLWKNARDRLKMLLLSSLNLGILVSKLCYYF
jgi:hypothetical protein